LDCATKTGWAILEDGRIVESGVQTFDLQRGESPGMRFLRFRAWLESMVSAVDVIAYEAAHHRGGAATELCVGMTTRVQEVAAARKSECVPVHTGRLKKWATGSGSAKKEAMIERARSLSNTIIDDNHAEAILLARYAWQEVGGA